MSPVGSSFRNRLRMFPRWQIQYIHTDNNDEDKILTFMCHDDDDDDNKHWLDEEQIPIMNRGNEHWHDNL